VFKAYQSPGLFLERRRLLRADNARLAADRGHASNLHNLCSKWLPDKTGIGASYLLRACSCLDQDAGGVPALPFSEFNTLRSQVAVLSDDRVTIFGRLTQPNNASIKTLSI
jgi:hypothetical protein